MSHINLVNISAPNGKLFEPTGQVSSKHITQLLHIFPVSISTHGIALNITVQSYRDQLDFGFIAGANIIPHVQVLCDMLPGEFAVLQAAFTPPADRQSVAS